MKYSTLQSFTAIHISHKGAGLTYCYILSEGVFSVAFDLSAGVLVTRNKMNLNNQHKLEVTPKDIFFHRGYVTVPEHSCILELHRILTMMTKGDVGLPPS